MRVETSKPLDTHCGADRVQVVEGPSWTPGTYRGRAYKSSRANRPRFERDAADRSRGTCTAVFVVPTTRPGFRHGGGGRFWLHVQLRRHVDAVYRSAIVLRLRDDGACVGLPGGVGGGCSFAG
jgi:hypothetical protein